MTSVLTAAFEARRYTALGKQAGLLSGQADGRRTNHSVGNAYRKIRLNIYAVQTSSKKIQRIKRPGASTRWFR